MSLISQQNNIRFIQASIAVIILALVSFGLDFSFYQGKPNTITFLEQFTYSIFNFGILISLFIEPNRSNRLIPILMIVFGSTLQVSDYFYSSNYYFSNLKDETVYLWMTTLPLSITFLSITLVLAYLNKNIFFNFQCKKRSIFLALSTVLIFFITYKLFVVKFTVKYGHEDFFPNHIIRTSPILFGATAAILGLLSVVKSQHANTKILGLGAFIHVISDFALRFKSYVNASIFYGIAEYTYFIGAAFVCLSCISRLKQDKKQIYPSINQTLQTVQISTLLITFVVGFQFFQDYKTIEFLLCAVSMMSVSIFIGSLLVDLQIDTVYQNFSDKKFYQEDTPIEFHKLRNLILEKQQFESLAKILPKVSHEFKTPFVLTELALKAHLKVAGENNVISKMVPGIRMSINAGMSLVDSLMNISKISRTIVKHENSLQKILYESIVGASAINKKKNYMVRVNLKHTHKILCNACSVVSVLRNIISNDMAAMKDPTKDIIDIESIPVPTKNQTLITIKNSGSFICGSDLKNIFNSFYTVNKPDGNGLGLAIAKKNTEENGGKIWCESNPKEPSVTFYILLNNATKLDEEDIMFFPKSFDFLDEVFVKSWK